MVEKDLCVCVFWLLKLGPYNLNQNQKVICKNDIYAVHIITCYVDQHGNQTFMGNNQRYVLHLSGVPLESRYFHCLQPCNIDNKSMSKGFYTFCK